MEPHFTATTEQKVLHLRFGQPGVRNLMDDAWFDALEAHLAEAGRDPGVRVVLLSAEGDAFCSGANLKGVQHGLLSQGYEQSALARLLRRLTTFDKPLVAAVHGLAIGGGTTLLLHCDFVYAAEGTRFQMPFAKLGLVPEFGSSYLLPLNAGMRLASELVLLGEPFDPETALRAGLVNAVVPGAELLARARRTADVLAQTAPGPLRRAKLLLRQGHQAALAAALAAEGQALQESLQSPELAEAVTAFIEKRAPDFSRF
ncbi:enoyl-CoA hydratase/isomerase family protein [Simplicispira lacusdiani]|uniref:enoyl-CoA hydratase/isomerase family protein n=1 Tax=Simplicispira lacusdiani TaxID=2213010 RepID=UPI000E72C8B8|nr:enoyl-CoA hydratase-related protein [Simplicispira lacusdiani]